MVALAWANSPWGPSYESLWSTRLDLGVEGWHLPQDLRHWVNDALMALFFFVVGVEIKRELVAGELRDRRAAALPVAAAVGGMLVPALVYLAFNAGAETARGWGVPTATDIAFAVGVLAVAGAGVPSSLKVSLLALAIVDDIGAILLIALFYSGALSWPAAVMGAALLGAMALLRKREVTRIPVYLLLGLGVWLATFRSGLHSTVAAVAVGLLAPATPPGGESADLSASHSTATRLLDALHPWTSFVVIPLFALANAGVALSGDALGAAWTSSVTIGIVVGLVLGKPAGILVGAWAGGKLGAAGLPEDATPSQAVGVASVAGIGFTVSLFMANLAFRTSAQVDEAKVGILAGSIVAGLVGAAVLRLPRRRPVGTTIERRSSAPPGKKDEE